MKLSPAQQTVIDLMSDGWQLGRDMGFQGTCWLQQGGVGRGGKTKPVSSATLMALYREGIIVPVDYHWPMEKFGLKSEA